MQIHKRCSSSLLQMLDKKMTICRDKCLAKLFLPLRQLSWICCHAVNMIFVLIDSKCRLHGQASSWLSSVNLERKVLRKNCSYHWDSCPDHVAMLSEWYLSSWTQTPDFRDNGHLDKKMSFCREKCLAKVVPTIETVVLNMLPCCQHNLCPLRL